MYNGLFSRHRHANERLTELEKLHQEVSVFVYAVGSLALCFMIVSVVL